MDRDKRHKKVVRQRIIAFILTIFVLCIVSFGTVWGIIHLKETGFFDRLPKPKPKVEEEVNKNVPTEEEAAAEGEKEVKEDGKVE